MDREASPNASTLIGSVLEGAYRITRLVGEGGMGWVYEAVQLRINKRVAIKLMARELASHPEALARFHREAEITSRLGHPHLVTVVDFGTSEAGEPYLVMEYLDGEDLDHRLRRVGRLPLEVAVEITKQVASALDAAHAEGVVHRDLKPANVFLLKMRDEGEFVKVLDFGVSKIKATRTKLTRATAVIGTPDYMSPEQASGLIEEIDHRTDQWALGCIAWEMLSGHAPFIADDMSALFFQILNMDPHPLSRRAPGLPLGVEPVLRRALAKQAADRFPSIRDFSRAFEAAATGRQRELTPAPVEVAPQPSPAKETVAYGQAVAPAEPDGWEGKTEIAPQPSILIEEMLATHSDAPCVPTIRPWWRRFNLVHIAIAGAVVVMLVLLLVLWPSKAPPAAPSAVAPAPVPPQPEIITLPAPAPEPVAAPVPAARGPKAKAKSPSLDDLLKRATTEKAATSGKPSPFAEPSGAARARPNPFAPQPPPTPAKRRPQRSIVEDL